ncbi:hypothetical protein R3P38DRAFT_2556149, partial [Favolaschia claudopus]
VANLLVIGNIPPFPPTERERITLPINISADPELRGAFGLGLSELRSLYSALSLNRHISLGNVTSDDSLQRELGFEFTPSPTNNSVPGVCPTSLNFGLTLHCITTTLDIDSPHRSLFYSDWLVSGWLRGIAQSCQHLLQYSSIRRGRRILVRPFNAYDLPSFLAYTEKEPNLLPLLYFLGVLTVLPEPEEAKPQPDPMWALRICNSLAAHELFSTYPPFLHPLESIRTIQLRALFERNPGPIIKASSWHLFHTCLLDLIRMDEQTFQAIWNGLMVVDHTFFEDGDPVIELTSEYINNYFSQVSLFTNAQAPRGRSAERVVFGSGRGRFGFSDIVICGSAVHPGRVIVLELKYCSLWNLFRATVSTDPECEEMLNGVNGPSTRWTKCQALLDELDKMTEQEILEQHYHLYRSEGAVDQPDKGSYTVGTIVEDGKAQLQSYMRALVNGKAFQSYQGSEQEGIHTRESRIEAIVASPPDKIIGFVVYAVGRRTFWVEVEPLQQNKYFQYRAKPGWQVSWGSNGHI